MSAPDTEELRLGIFGRGRLGSAIADRASGERGVEVVWMLGGDDALPDPAGVDVAIDASIAAAVGDHLGWAAEGGVALVVGATGWDDELLADRGPDDAAVLVAPNFSLGAAMLRRLSVVLGRWADQDPGRDPYVIDHHHRHKRDAPSGTARSLAEAVLEGCSRKSEWVLVDGAVEEHQLSVSSVRAGAEFGSHTVGVDAPAEVLEIHHRARSREAFAAGALAAARWVRGRRGLFTFDDVVADLLDPLFDPRTRE